jgi:hypothetical protein
MAKHSRQAGKSSVLRGKYQHVQVGSKLAPQKYQTTWREGWSLDWEKW